MITMMTDAGVRAAQNAAYRRIGELESKRRKAVMAAVGSDYDKKIIIMGNGSLWVRSDDHKIVARIMELLDIANVDAFAQWTPAPDYDCCNIDEWLKAGRKIGGAK